MKLESRNGRLTRRALLRLAGWCASVALPSAGAGEDSRKRSVFANAVAVWHMADVQDSCGPNSELVPTGDVKLAVRLLGDERQASLMRGGDGFAAQFSDGLFDAGDGARGKLNITGSAITIVVRLRDPSGRWNSPIFTKGSGAETELFNIFSADLGDGMVLGAEIGSDEVAGMHSVKTGIAAIGPTAWHDVAVRFNGDTLELFVDGNVVDDEMAVGTLRRGVRKPCLIGGVADAVSDKTVTGFHGLIDHAAIWDRALSNNEVARLSGVPSIGDRRPTYYHETYRPQFHFTPRKHWMNDPNGLFYYKGVYHMCFQHMPPGRPGAYKDWGHAVSTDLVHWTQQRSALTPHRLWGGCWSGSAVVDWNNTTGFQSGREKPIVAILTNGGKKETGPPCTQCIAYSTDGGATFTYYDANPVIRHIVDSNRDPKVFWHAPTEKWIMALYLTGSEYALFASPDLKKWQHLSDLKLSGVSECPDMFELPVDGDAGNKKWVFWCANGKYLIGTFDGRTFRPESDLLRTDYGSNFYAAQTWSDIPASDGRRIQVAWMARGKYPGMPFNQQMNFPTEVTLRTTSEGFRMYRVPVREIQKVHGQGRTLTSTVLKPGGNCTLDISGGSFHIRADIEPGKAAAFGLNVSGQSIRCDLGASTIISCLGQSAPLTAGKGHIRLEILVDRTSLEVFADDGRVVLTSAYLRPEVNGGPEFYAEGGEAHLISAEVFPLTSIWP